MKKTVFSLVLAVGFCCAAGVVSAQSIQFSFGNRIGEYTEGVDGPAHVFGQLSETENFYNLRGGETGSTAAILEPVGPYFDASGVEVPSVSLALGTGIAGSDVDFTATPRQTGVNVGDPPNGAIDNGLWADYLFSDGRDGGNDHIAARIGGLEAGEYRVYAIFREAAQATRTHDVDIGVSADASVEFGDLGPVHVGVAGDGNVGGSTFNDTLELNDEYYTEDVTVVAGDNLFVILDPTNSDFGGLAGIQLVKDPTDALRGDFNDDGVVDLADLDRYIGNLGEAAEGEFAELDLDESGFVDLPDFTEHYSELVATSNGGVGTVQGDLNLDGIVDIFGDGFTFLANVGLDPAISWGQGDFNADGIVDIFGDGFALLNNIGADNGGAAAAPATSAVPEPGSLSMLALAGLGAAMRRKR